MIGLQRLNTIINTSCKTAVQRSTCYNLSKDLLSKSVCASFVDHQPPQQPHRFDAKWFSSTSSPTKGTNFYHKADGKVDYGYVSEDGRFDGVKPTIAYARSMPCDYSAMRHEQILQLSVEGDYGARKEALTRNIMAIESIEHEEAEKIVEEIKGYNYVAMWVHHIPYKLGLASAMTAGMLSFPFIFHRGTVEWFNEKYVTTDVPIAADLETPLEIAIWSWNWMEPICGQVSFVLLVLQFARAQMSNLGLRPYGNMMKNFRANQLVKKYPKYNELFVRWYSDGHTLFGA